jgi:hypothetical protein
VAEGIDLGPIRIEGCKTTIKGSNQKQYTLTLGIGDSVYTIVTSQQGNSVHVFRDDIELTSAYDDRTAGLYQ